MSEKTNKEIETEESEVLDDDDLERISGGTWPSVSPFYAPDGTILPPK